jgi:hypothetical protein
MLLMNRPSVTVGLPTQPESVRLVFLDVFMLHTEVARLIQGLQDRIDELENELRAIREARPA